MNMVYILKTAGISFIALVILNGCSSYAGDTKVSRGFFIYQSVHLSNTFIGIDWRENRDLGQITLSDAYIDGTAGIRNQYYYASSDQIGFYFAYPIEGAVLGESWEFEDCNYSLLEQVEANSSSEKMVYLQFIESHCTDLEVISRFWYSTSRGLLSISFGDSKKEGGFNLQQSFILFDMQKGFGVE